MFSAKKLRVMSASFLCLFMISTLAVCLYTMHGKRFDPDEVAIIVKSTLLLYSPVLMLIVGHLVATNGIEEDSQVSSVYFILYMTSLVLYLASPLISVLMINPIIDAIEKSKSVLAVVELPLFLMIGMIFSSQEKTLSKPTTHRA